MKAVKNLKLAFTFIGTLIGAGFASGREVALYFGAASPLSAVLGGFFCGVFCYIFIELGRASDGDILSYSFKRVSKAVNFLIIVSNLIVFCVMLAACEYIVKGLFGISGGTVISAVLAVLVIFLGVEKIKLLNLLAVPLLAALIIYIFLAARPPMAPFIALKLQKPFLYAGMNILSGGFLISKLAKDADAKDSAAISIIVGAALGALVLVIHLLIQDRTALAMPLLSKAEELGLDFLASTALYLAVFTTLIGSLYITAGEDIKKALLASSAGLLISFFGFKALTDVCYPLIGYGGFALTLYGLFALIKNKLNRQSLRSCSRGCR